MAPNDNHLHNVAILGGGGQLGQPIVNSLLASTSPKFHVTVITRSESASVPSSWTSNPAITIARGSYTDPTFLVETLKGQDVLIISLAFTVPPEFNTQFIKAAAEAGVPYILPTEFGSDTSRSELVSRVVFQQPKVAARKLIEELGVSSWIGVVTNAWYEMSLRSGTFEVDVKNKKALLLGGGDVKAYTTTIPTVGVAVARILALPRTSSGGQPSLEGYRNKLVYISSFYVSQKDILEAVQNVVGRDGWQVANKDLKEYLQEGKDELAAGNVFSGLMKISFGSTFDPGVGNDYSGPLANEVLGLPQEDFQEVTKKVVEEILAK